MANFKSIKRAIFTSTLSLLLCFAMLLGTTFAWFTDSASSSDNKIVTGTLDVDLYEWTAADANREITNEAAPLFGTDLLWEPGKTEVVYLSIKNNGTLALKYKVALVVKEISDHALTDVMQYAIYEDARFDSVTAWDASRGVYATPGTNDTQANDVELLPGEEHFFALAIHMDETATNEYMAESIVFDVKVLAGQLTSEEDSFDNTYDENAIYPGLTVVPAMGATDASVEVNVRGEDGYKLGSVLIPKDAADENASEYKVTMNPTYYDGNFTVANGLETKQFDINVEGIKAGNTTELTVEVRLPAGLDPNTVKVYHIDTLVNNAVYDPYTGDVTFKITSFSPFTFVYDAESEYVAPEVPEGMSYPKAIVTYNAEHVGKDIEWFNWEGLYPTAGLGDKFEAAFKFVCPEMTEEQFEVFKYWDCDFYVSLSTDLEIGQIFLGGYYGSFDKYVGFHNAGALEIELPANEPIALIGSFGMQGLKYNDVKSFVGEFICGVADVNDALAGETFTVRLRLTNPENENEYYDVNVVNYTFGGERDGVIYEEKIVIDGQTIVRTAEELKDAIENGGDEVNIGLGGNIDLNDLMGNN